MTKAELMTRIIDAMVDPWTDCPDDYLTSTPIDIHEATDLLAQLREDEDSMDLEPDERVPQEATPALIMEAYNCLIRARKFDARVERLAEWITDEDCVCEYANYYFPAHDDAIDVFPVDFLADTDASKLITGEVMTTLELIKLGQRSPEFSSGHEYCWYDKDRRQLVSTNSPFSDGTLDAEAFARFILLDRETFDYMFDHIIDDDDIESILGCTKEEYINEQF